GQARGEGQQQHQGVLGDGRRAVALAVADADAALARSGKIDIVEAGSGDQNQLQIGAGTEYRIAQRYLVDDGDLRALQAFDDLLIIRLRMAGQFVEDRLQRSQVEVTLVERGEVEKYGAAIG